jgi:hypothetical protein
VRRISTAGSAASSDTARLEQLSAYRLAISPDLGNTVGMQFLVVIIC